MAAVSEAVSVRKPKRSAAIGTIESPIGPLTAAVSSRGIAALLFGDEPHLPAKLALLHRRFHASGEQAPLAQIADELTRYFAGDPEALATPPDLELFGTAFARQVAAKLIKLRPDQVISYQNLARQTGSPGASRAVGRVMATNPIVFYVPCHRVIQAGGRMGNYGGGVLLKRRLLELEGHRFDARGRVTTLQA